MAGDGGLIGRLALEAGMITRDQLRRATREQGHHPDKRIGEILVALGILDDVQLGKLLALQARVAQRGKRKRDTPIPAKRAAPEKVPLGAIALKRVAGTVARQSGAPPKPDEPIASPAMAAKPVPMALPRTMAAGKKVLSETTKWLHATLEDAARAGVSDVLLRPGAVVRVRRFSRLHDLTTGPVSAEASDAMLADCLDDASRASLAQEGHAALMYDAGEAGRYRLSVFHGHGGCSGVFHRVPDEPPTLDSLGLPSALAKLTTFSSGLVILSGPISCGKSYTLAALLHLINEERDDHILAIHRVIECVHAPRAGVVSQVEVGRHVATAAAALRTAMRQDADVIAVDPLDDAEAISAAVTAADGGKLVIATMARRSAVRAIASLVEAYPPAQQSQACAWLAGSLRAVVSQRLVPAVDEQSSMAALEVVYLDDAIRRAIRDRRIEEIPDAVLGSPNRDSFGLDDSLARLFRAGQVSLDVARQNAHNPHNFRG